MTSVALKSATPKRAESSVPGPSSSGVGMGLVCEIVDATKKSQTASKKAKSDSKSLSKIIYTVNMKCTANGCEWKILKRYSDFGHLHSQLESDIEFRGIRVPVLPGKAFTLFESAKKDLIASRRVQLQEYLSQLIAREVFATSKHLLAFLEMPETVKKIAISVKDALHRPIKDGYMWKKGEYNTKWRRRWFVLHCDHILKYYTDDSCDTLKGAIDMSTIAKVSTRVVTKASRKHTGDGGRFAGFAPISPRTMPMSERKSEAKEEDITAKEAVKEFPILLKARDREWHLAAESSIEKKEWSKAFMRAKDVRAIRGFRAKPMLFAAATTAAVTTTTTTTAPLSAVSAVESSAAEPGSIIKVATLSKSSPLSSTLDIFHSQLRVGPHSGAVTCVSWCPVLPRLVATGAEDNTVKLWSVAMFGGGDDAEARKGALTLVPMTEWHTSGRVMALQWSPNGDTLVASLMKPAPADASATAAYFIQCFDLRSVLRMPSTQTKKAHSHTSFDIDDDDATDDTLAAEGRGPKIFTLQDCAKWICCGHSRKTYLCMDIDPLSDDSKTRRPAFVVYLDLTTNRLQRCRPVDRLLDHATERITAMAMNASRSLMAIATGNEETRAKTDSADCRLLAWDVDTDVAAVIEERGSVTTGAITAMAFTDCDEWLLTGRQSGFLEFWKHLANDSTDTLVEDALDATRFSKLHSLASEGPAVAAISVSGSLCVVSSGASQTLYDLRPLFAKPSALPKRVGAIDGGDAVCLRALSPVIPEHAGLGALLLSATDSAVTCNNVVDVVLDCLL